MKWIVGAFQEALRGFFHPKDSPLGFPDNEDRSTDPSPRGPGGALGLFFLCDGFLSATSSAACLSLCWGGWDPLSNR